MSALLQPLLEFDDSRLQTEDRLEADFDGDARSFDHVAAGTGVELDQRITCGGVLGRKSVESFEKFLVVPECVHPQTLLRFMSSGQVLS